MKLVEILARDLGAWPVNVALRQLASGAVCEANGGSLVGYYDIAEDLGIAEVTRHQWQAERDRMQEVQKIKVNLKMSDDDLEKLKGAMRKPMPLEQIPEPTYEQQLWDRVYLKAFNEVHALYPTITAADVAYSAADIADAFIAERAKRVGK